MSTIPFAYHLYHKPTGKHYYGVRFKRGTVPSDLWSKYFSSSKVVHQLIEEYGKDSFTFTVRKTFTSGEEALRWEHRFLTRINAADRNDWINRHNGGKKFRGPKQQTEKTRQTIRQKLTGRPKSEEWKTSMRDKAKKFNSTRKESGWTMPKESVERRKSTTKHRISQGIINPYSPERNSKMAASKRGTKRQYMPDGSFVMVRPT